MRVLVVIDSLKGSLTSREAAEAVCGGVLRACPTADVSWLPVADGGEGTVEALVTGLDGRFLETTVTGPLGEPVRAEYGWLPHQRLAVFEMAQAAGLPLVPAECRNPMHTTSRGVGEMLLDALDRGFRRFLIGIGGSATNDCGIGMLEALGCRFFDAGGAETGGFGRDVGQIARVDASGLDPRLRECEIQVACDVNNPLCGPLGASMVYGPQKGAGPELAAQMDRDHARFAGVVQRSVAGADPDSPGAGAAGGLGFALQAFLHAQMRPGIDLVLDAVGFRQAVCGADVVFTGEGRLDSQTAMGKVPVGVASAARQSGALVVALAGCVTKDAGACNAHGIDAFFPILRMPCSEEQAMEREQARQNMTAAAEQVTRLIAACGQKGGAGS